VRAIRFPRARAGYFPCHHHRVAPKGGRDMYIGIGTLILIIILIIIFT
jgi:hypothetical protein